MSQGGAVDWGDPKASTAKFAKKGGEGRKGDAKEVWGTGSASFSAYPGFAPQETCFGIVWRTALR